MIGSNQKLLMAGATQGPPATPPDIGDNTGIGTTALPYSYLSGDLIVIHENNRTVDAPAPISGFTTIHAVNDGINGRSMRTSYRIADSAGSDSTPQPAANSYVLFAVVSNGAGIGAQNTRVVSGTASDQVLPDLSGLKQNSLLLGSCYFMGTPYSESEPDWDLNKNLLMFSRFNSATSISGVTFQNLSLVPFKNTWAIEVLSF